MKNFPALLKKITAVGSALEQDRVRFMWLYPYNSLFGIFLATVIYRGFMLEKFSGIVLLE